MTISQDTTTPSAATSLKGRCIGCVDCAGLCRAALDLLTVPSTVLKTKTEVQ